MLTLVQLQLKPNADPQMALGKAVVLPSNIERVDEGTTGEFRHKYDTTVSEHGSFMGKALNCVNVD